eukprot:11176399-Lingulodinium_polyedra.AAC.1
MCCAQCGFRLAGCSDARGCRAAGSLATRAPLNFVRWIKRPVVILYIHSLRGFARHYGCADIERGLADVDCGL